MEYQGFDIELASLWWRAVSQRCFSPTPNVWGRTLIPSLYVRQCPSFRCLRFFVASCFGSLVFVQGGFVRILRFYHGKSSCFTTIREIFLDFCSNHRTSQKIIRSFVSSSHDIFRKSTRIISMSSSSSSSSSSSNRRDRNKKNDPQKNETLPPRLGASRWRIFELLHHFTSLRWDGFLFGLRQKFWSK